MSYTAAVITVSDKASRGERIDTSGPAVKKILEEAGFAVVYTSVVPDRSEEHTSELQSRQDISYAVFCLKKYTQRMA